MTAVFYRQKCDRNLKVRQIRNGFGVYRLLVRAHGDVEGCFRIRQLCLNQEPLRTVPFLSAKLPLNYSHMRYRGRQPVLRNYVSCQLIRSHPNPLQGHELCLSIFPHHKLTLKSSRLFQCLHSNICQTKAFPSWNFYLFSGQR